MRLLTHSHISVPDLILFSIERNETVEKRCPVLEGIGTPSLSGTGKSSQPPSADLSRGDTTPPGSTRHQTTRIRELLTNPAIKTESIRTKHLELVETQSKLEEKAIEYLVKVRSLLTYEQLKSWCPEQEFHLFQRMMPGHSPMGPMNPKRALPPEE